MFWRWIENDNLKYNVDEVEQVVIWNFSLDGLSNRRHSWSRPFGIIYLHFFFFFFCAIFRPKCETSRLNGICFCTGKPQSVHNCTVRNNTEGAVDIQCEPGYDGGLSQVFVLEVFTENLDSQEDGEVLYRNMTDRTAPRFFLGKVASGVLYTARMYAANSKGRATPVTLPRFSFPSSENQMGEYSYDVIV